MADSADSPSPDSSPSAPDSTPSPASGSDPSPDPWLSDSVPLMSSTILSAAAASVTTLTPYTFWCDDVQKHLDFQLEPGNTFLNEPSAFLRDLYRSGYSSVRAALILWRMKEGLPLAEEGAETMQGAAEETPETATP